MGGNKNGYHFSQLLILSVLLSASPVYLLYKCCTQLCGLQYHWNAARCCSFCLFTLSWHACISIQLPFLCVLVSTTTLAVYGTCLLSHNGMIPVCLLKCLATWFAHQNKTSAVLTLIISKPENSSIFDIWNYLKGWIWPTGHMFDTPGLHSLVFNVQVS